MNFLAPFHPQITHGPVVLLIVGFAFEVVGLALDRSWWRKAASAMLVLGVAGAVLAVLSGREAAEQALKQHVPDEAIDAHEIMAYMTLWYALGALVLKAIAARVRRFRGAIAALSFVGWLVACVFVAIAAHRGGQLVFEHGAAVRNAVHPRSVEREEHPGTHEAGEAGERR